MLQQPTIYQQSKEKKVTKKVVRFVKDYQEDPQEVHESVKQTAKDVSKQAAEVIQQTKEKLVLEKLRQELFWNLSKKKTQDVVENLKKSITHLRINFKRKSKWQ